MLRQNIPAADKQEDYGAFADSQQCLAEFRVGTFHLVRLRWDCDEDTDQRTNYRWILDGRDAYAVPYASVVRWAYLADVVRGNAEWFTPIERVNIIEKERSLNA